ncbi:MAG: RHS repeat-associated core domain-containing protein [Hyphomicrobiaceae bacterium]|nr:RHS repeat-associated core domain-containing protein [Hyphomicrobiaceae bacterium]
MHYNWHRHYDPTIGRYTQPNPLGFVDGPSVYGYAGGTPYRSVDPEGRYWWLLTPAARCATNPKCRTVVINYCKRKLKEFWKDEHGGSRKAPNQTANKQAADALAEAARRQNREVTRQLEREWHDHITGEGFDGYQELLQEALRWLLEQ